MATHWRDCWRRQEHNCTQYNSSSVSAHNPTAAPQPQLNKRGVSAQKHPAPPQTQLNSSSVSAHSLRAPSLPQPVILFKPIRTSRGKTAAALRFIHRLQHHHPQAPAEPSHLYLYSTFNNINGVKATAQYQNRKIMYH